MMFILLLIVGKVGFLLAACSGFQAPFNKRSNTLFVPRSNNATRSSVLGSDIISSYNN